MWTAEIKIASLDVQGCWCFRFHDDTGATGLISHLQTALKALLLIAKPGTNQTPGNSIAVNAETAKQSTEGASAVSVQAVFEQLGPEHVQQLLQEALLDPDFPRLFSPPVAMHGQFCIMLLDLKLKLCVSYEVSAGSMRCACKGAFHQPRLYERACKR